MSANYHQAYLHKACCSDSPQPLCWLADIKMMTERAHACSCCFLPALPSLFQCLCWQAGTKPAVDIQTWRRSIASPLTLPVQEIWHPAGYGCCIVWQRRLLQPKLLPG